SVRLRIFSDFIDTLSSLSVRCLALHKRGAQRQLVRSEPHCFLGFDWRHAFHLEQNLARTNHGYPVIRSSLTFTHTGFSRLLGHGLVREQANPDFAAPLDETSHCHAARFDLPVGNPAGLKDFQPILPESERAAAPGFAGHAAALLLAVLHFLWHQHKISSRFSVVRKASRWNGSVCLLNFSLLKRAGSFPLWRRFTFLLRQNFAAVNPALHANHAVGGTRFGETVLNVGAQRVKRQASL